METKRTTEDDIIEDFANRIMEEWFEAGEITLEDLHPDLANAILEVAHRRYDDLPMEE